MLGIVRFFINRVGLAGVFFSRSGGYFGLCFLVVSFGVLVFWGCSRYLYRCRRGFIWCLIR